MTRALAAIFKSAIDAEIDRNRLDHDEVVAALLDMAVHHAPRAGMDARALHAKLDDTLAARAARLAGKPA